MPSMPRGAGARVLAGSGALPAISLAATLAVILHRLPLMVGWVQNSDSTGPMLVAEAVGRIPHGARVTMGATGNLSIVGLDVLTRWVPGHRTLWLAFPFVLEMAAIVLLVVPVRLLAGWRAALVCAAIAAATPPALLTPLLSQAFHNTAFFLLAATGALLVWQSGAPRPLAPGRLVACAVLGVVAGIQLLSDHLFLIGLAALVGGAGLVWLPQRDRRSRDLLVSALGTAFLAVVVWRIGSTWAEHANVHAGGLTAQPAGPHRIVQNLRLLRDVLLAMVNGGSTAPGALLLRLGCAALGLVGLLVVAWAVLRVMLRRAATADPARTAFVVYWGAVATLLLAAFVFSQIPVDISAIRYMAPVLWAVAAIVPLVVAGSQLRTALLCGAVAIVGLYGAVVLAGAPQGDFQESQGVDALTRALDAQHVEHGYAGYWQADMLTW